MFEAKTVCRDRAAPLRAFVIEISARKLFDIKILSASDCAP
jgi:hypothetical protein